MTLRSYWRASCIFLSLSLSTHIAECALRAENLQHAAADSTQPRRPAAVAPALHASAASKVTGSSFFAVLGSFRSAAGAMRHLHDLRGRNLELDAAVYPPFYRRGYWTVVSAAHASKREAEQHASYARTSGLQADAYVRRLTSTRHRRLDRYDMYRPSVSLPEYPNFLYPPEPHGTASPSHFVFISEGATQDEVRTHAREVREAFPGVHVAVYPPRVDGEPFRLAIAAHASAEDAQAAVLLARRLNLSETETPVVLPAVDSRSWIQRDPDLDAIAQKVRLRVEQCFRDGAVTMGEMRACSGNWVTPKTLAACIGGSTTPAEGEPECELVPDNLAGAELIAKQGFNVSTVLQLDPSANNYLKVSYDQLAACEGKTGSDLQNCIFPQLFSPTQKAVLSCLEQDSREQVARCFAEKAAAVQTGAEKQRLDCLAKSNGGLDTALQCLGPTEAGSVKAYRTLLACAESATSEKDLKRGCFEKVAKEQAAKCIADYRSAPEALASCLTGGSPEELKRVEACAAERDLQKRARCLTEDLGSVLGSIPAAVANCMQVKDAAGLGSCLKNADGRFAAAEGLLSCTEASADSPVALVEKCGNKVLSEDQRKAATCLLALGGPPADALASCSAAEGIVSGLEIAECIQKHSGNAEELARCMVADRPINRGALETALCMRASNGDPAKTARCVAPKLGGTAGEVLDCVASQPEGKRDAVACLAERDPRLREAHRVYQCATSVGDTAELIDKCSEGIVNSETRQAASCVARAGGDRAKLAACAGQALLPGEAGRLAGCAASSGGASSFALCTFAPDINEEFRIAAECAETSGGEPISFAGCTGGRLTARELTKCVAGGFGKDCFGPNNSIRKYYETMYNDLVHGPGPNNDIVKAVNVAGEGVKALSDGVNHVGQELSKEAQRREENARERLSKPLDNPLKTGECLITLGNSCN